MLQHAITDAVRAVQRSLGPAGKAGEIRPEILNSFWSVTKKHPTKRRPLEPAAGIHAWSFAAAFLLREVELCCLTLDEECISLDSVKCWVTLHLPASKMDPGGRGARRTRQSLHMWYCQKGLSAWSRKRLERDEEQGILLKPNLILFWAQRGLFNCDTISGASS